MIYNLTEKVCIQSISDLHENIIDSEVTRGNFVVALSGGDRTAIPALWMFCSWQQGP